MLVYQRVVNFGAILMNILKPCVCEMDYYKALYGYKWTLEEKL